MGRLQSAVKIIYASDTDILTVEVHCGSPQLCAQLANYYIEHLDTINEDIRMTTSKPILQVLDAATVPLGPYEPNVKQNTMLAGVGSLVMGIFLIFLWEFAVSALRAVREP